MKIISFFSLIFLIMYLFYFVLKKDNLALNILTVLKIFRVFPKIYVILLIKDIICLFIICLQLYYIIGKQ